jgi:hypothetical protein
MVGRTAAMTILYSGKRVFNPRSLVYVYAAGVLLIGMLGCGVFRQQQPKYVTVGEVKVGSVTVEELEQRILDFADTFTQRIAQAFLEIEAEAGSPEVRKWAQKGKVNSAVSAYDIATGRNPVTNMFNMIVMVQLYRIVMEEYWIPEKFPEAADELLPIFEQTSEEVWRLAEGILSEGQKQQLNEIILDWRRRNPNQQIVEFVRFDDFAEVREQRASPGSGSPTSIFRLFYLDPLANLDPVAREVYYTRLFAERAFFYGQRLPTLLVNQAKSAYYDILATPEFRGVLTDIDTFAAVSERFADSVGQLSEQVAAEREAALTQMSDLIEKERTAAIDQMAERVAGEREALLAAMEEQESTLRGLLAESRETLAQAEKTAAGLQGTATAVESAVGSLDQFVGRFQKEKPPGEEKKGRPFDITEYGQAGAEIAVAARELNEAVKSLDTLVTNPQLTGENSAVVRSLERAEQTGKEIVDRAFRYLVILLILLLLGLPTVLLIYRYTAQRFLSPPHGSGPAGR